jgi:probable F420-dependent oxidoreductase
MPMKIDYYFPPQPVAGATEAARRARAIGFDGFFSAETAHDPFLPLAAASIAEPGLDLGTAITVAFPRSPMVLAQTAWDLAALSRGRFILGLGTQVRAHIVHRFGMEWTSAAGRLRDYLGALRATWTSFQTGEPLRYRSEHYTLSLLTPFFAPEPMDWPDIPVAIAGVGPGLSRLAGELCDGFHVHPFHTVRYLDQVVLPNIVAGASAAGRRSGEVQLISTVFVVTGRTEAEMAVMREGVRSQIAFYASTPSYRVVLDVHGWDFGDELNALSRRGAWKEMAALVPDEVVDEVAVVAPLDELGAAIKARYGDRLARVGYYTLAGDVAISDADLAALVESTR